MNDREESNGSNKRRKKWREFKLIIIRVTRFLSKSPLRYIGGYMKYGSDSLFILVAIIAVVYIVNPNNMTSEFSRIASSFIGITLLYSGLFEVLNYRSNQKFIYGFIFSIIGILLILYGVGYPLWNK